MLKVQSLINLFLFVVTYRLSLKSLMRKYFKNSFIVAFILAWGIETDMIQLLWCRPIFSPADVDGISTNIFSFSYLVRYILIVIYFIFFICGVRSFKHKHPIISRNWLHLCNIWFSHKFIFYLYFWWICGIPISLCELSFSAWCFRSL